MLYGGGYQHHSSNSHRSQQNHHSRTHSRDSSNHHHHNHHEQQTTRGGIENWSNDRDNQSQPSILDLGRHEWMGQPYTYNASPLSWFQRYYYYHGVATTGVYRQFREQFRDEHYFTSSGSIPDAELNQQQQQQCASCCEAFCGLLCCMLCCGCFCRKNQSANPNEGDIFERPHLRRSTSASRYKASSGFCLVFILTIALPVVLLHASRGDHVWSLNPGESHQITPAFLNNRITVTSAGQVEAQVYSLNGACPSLTGPPLSFSDHQNISLDKDGYEFDYFYLNEGSTIDVHLTVSSGSVHAYLLQGNQFLRQLEKSSLTVGTHQYLEKQFATAGHQVTIQHFIETTDTYLLVYDNARAGASSLSVSLNLNLTTYDLSHHSPTCSNAALHTCTLFVPVVPQMQKDCLLVQAAPTSSSTQDVATVHIVQHRHYGWLVMISLLPLLAYSFWPCCHEDPTRSYEELYDAVSTFPPAVSQNYHDYSSSREIPTPIPPPSLILHANAGRSSEINSYPVDVTNTMPIPVNPLHSYQSSYFK